MSEQLLTNKSTQLSKPSYLYAIISITLVLFMLGLLGMILLEARKLSAYFKENITVTLILSDQIPDDELQDLQEQLKTMPAIKQWEYISKDQALQRFTAQTKEDVQGILGFNPLFASIDLNLKANYANNDSLQNIKKYFQNNRLVKEIFYQESVLDLVSTNANKVSLILLILSVVFSLVALALIDNTIRLAMYSNRFLIKSMQLVGATRWFIANPFLRQSIYNGIISGILATIFLVLFLLLAQHNIPEIQVLHDSFQFLVLCILITLLGVAISWWSTRRSVIKYLQLRLDDLY